MSEGKSLIVIAGPTAVGKTGASILLAQELRSEIVSADSMQIYRGMDIGTAKPTQEQRRLVHHHMIDIVEPNHPYSVGDYCRDAQNAINRIIASRRTPIVVGGTGLYIRALTRGLFHGPPANNELREQFLLRERTNGPGALYRELVQSDPDAAIKIHPNDIRRTIRALEVHAVKNRKLSVFHHEHAFKEKPYRYTLLVLVRSRSELYPLIEVRVDQMIADGLEEEVKGLMERGYSPDLISMKGLGYQHFISFHLKKLSRSNTVALLKRDTKRFAKRQFTWFRREPNAVWIDITGLHTPEDIVVRIKKNIEISNKLV